MTKDTLVALGNDMDDMEQDELGVASQAMVVAEVGGLMAFSKYHHVTYP